MKEEIRRLLQATPFTPFAVDVAPDIAYSIATSDHANALVIIDDHGYIDLIPFSHIHRVRYLAEA
jgi:hypothetical protein